MSCFIAKRDISLKLCYEYEWSIKNFFSYTMQNKVFRSPTFSIPGSKWYVESCHNYQTGICNVSFMRNCLCLLINCNGSKPPKRGWTCDLKVKKVDGTVGMLSNHNFGFSKDEELPKSRVIKIITPLINLDRWSEFSLSGTLTLVCTMRRTDAWDPTRLIELSGDFENMFLSKENCDTSLKVQDKEFSVHKQDLAVFQTIHQPKMKKNTCEVDIVDCHPGAFMDFLEYLFSCKFDTSLYDIFELYRIARKYCAESLKTACVDFMGNNITADNVLAICFIGDQFNEPELKSQSLEHFKQHFADVVLTEEWESLIKEYPALANELIMNMANGMKMKQIEKK